MSRIFTLRVSEVFSGLRIAAAFISGVFTVGMVFIGAEILFAPSEKLLGFDDPMRARVLAGLALTFGATVVALTVKRWVKWLPGVLFVFALRSGMMAAKGHLLNNPDIPVDRFESTMTTGLLLLNCYVSTKLWDREIGRVERVVLLGYVACLTWSWATRQALLPFGIGAALLIVAWVQRRKV
jgi:hypothetical protein